MKIARVETLHCDAAWRTYSFLKVTTDTGLVGWSEYSEGWGYGGISAVIQSFTRDLIGQDALAHEALVGKLHLMSRPSRGGILHGAVAAIENALLDIKGKALGVPVYALFGGPVRTKLPIYWSHCGTYRRRHFKEVGKPEIRTLDDVTKLGEEVRASGLKAAKVNYLVLGSDKQKQFSPGIGKTPGYPALNYDPEQLEAIHDQVAAFRKGAGPKMGVMLDINFSFRTEGFIRLAKSLEDMGLLWLELDIYEPDALALIRRESPSPIASGEHLFGRRDYRPYFEKQAMDVAIIDVMWNGYGESVKIASMAESYEVNVAPHNYYGPLGDLQSAHFCAFAQNFRIMEIDIDTMPWQQQLLTHPAVIEDGHFILPDRPGWGADVNEDVLRAHPAKNVGGH